MKKYLIKFGIFLLVFFPSLVITQKDKIRAWDQNQNQTREQNQRQEQYQIHKGKGQGESIGSGWEKKITKNETNKTDDDEKTGRVKKTSPRSETAREHMSEVAKKVEEILTTQRAKGGIGEQIREIARGQNQAQEEIESEHEKMVMRGWMKKIIGPDFKAIKNLKKQVEKNQMRVRKLERLQNEAMNEGETQMVEEMIEVLNQQNTSLSEQIKAEEESFSLFGWLFKLF